MATMVDSRISPPIKQFEVVNNGVFTTRDLEVRHAGRPFIWAQTPVSFLSSPVIEMHTDSPQGPVIAAAKIPKFSNGVNVFVGRPNSWDGAGWTNAECGWGTGSWRFRGYGDGHLYEWRRTHNKAFGSTRLSNSDYKLVDPANNDKVLAVYVKDSFFGGANVGHIDFMVELGPELELQVLTMILGIEERLRRQRKGRNAAGSAGMFGGIAGAAGGGAGGAC